MIMVKLPKCPVPVLSESGFCARPLAKVSLHKLVCANSRASFSARALKFLRAILCVQAQSESSCANLSQRRLLGASSAVDYFCAEQTSILERIQEPGTLRVAQESGCPYILCPSDFDSPMAREPPPSWCLFSQELFLRPKASDALAVFQSGVVPCLTCPNCPKGPGNKRLTFWHFH